MSWPSTRIVPDVGRSSAPSRYSRVLLPEPDGPTMNVHDPRGTRNVTPRRASTVSSPLWNDLWTSTASITRLASGCCRWPGRVQFIPLRRIASIGVILEAFHAG